MNNKNTNLLSQVKQIIIITSAKGGVGKSTIALNTAIGLSQQGFQTGILDADLYGPNIPLMLDIDNISPQDIINNENPNIMYPIQKYNIKILSMQFFIKNNEAVIWRGPILSKMISQFLFDTQWGELDYLIIDMPPGTGDIDLTITQQIPITGSIIVTTAQSASIQDAQKNISMLDRMNIPIIGVIENMSYFTPDDNPSKQYDIFGSFDGETVKQAFSCPILTRIPLIANWNQKGENKIALIDFPDSLIAKALKEGVQQIIQHTQ